MKYSPLDQAFLNEPGRIRENVLFSPVFFPSRLGLKGQKTPIGNVVAHCKNLTFIKTYPGASWTRDTIHALHQTKCKNIYFVGTAGSLSSKHNIGDVVVVGGHYADLPTVNNVSLSSLYNGMTSQLRQLVKQGYDTVDLEVETFFEACRNIKRLALAWLVIQDKPLSKPFYKILSNNDKSKLDQGISRIIEICQTAIKNRSNI